MTRPLIFCLAISFFAASLSDAQTVIYVDDSAQPGGDGSSWQTAHRFLTDALDHAESTPTDDEIRIAEGTYWPDESAANPAGSGELCATFALPDSNEHGVTRLIGGYRGIGSAGSPDDRDSTLFETILSGDLLENDPAWPYLGNETEWDDNTKILIHANTQRVHIDGLVIQGAYSSSIITEYSFDHGTQIVSTESVFIRDTTCRDTLAINSSTSCSFNTTPGEVISLNNKNSGSFPTESQLLNVKIHRAGYLNGTNHIVKFGRGTTLWQGGGVTNTHARRCITSDPGESQSVGVVLRGLTLENIDLSTGYVYMSFEDIPSLVEQCSFRNIVIYNGSGSQYEPSSIIAFYASDAAASPQISKVVRDCTFENLGLPTEDYSAGAVVLAATLVERCDFADIHDHIGAVLFAREAYDCSFSNITHLAGFTGNSREIDFEIFFDTDLPPQTTNRIAVVLNAQGLEFTNCTIQGAILELVGSASDCVIQESVAADGGGGIFAAPLLAYSDSTLHNIEIINNSFGLPFYPANSFDNGSAGAVLLNNSELHNSRIEGNRVYSTNPDGFIGTPGAIEMYPGAGIYNSVIVGNGESVLPGNQVSHTAVRVFGDSDNPCNIVQSTICGNIGNYIGGIEIETFRPANVLWVNLINSVVANNICTREFIQPERWDLSTDEFSASTDPAGFLIVNSIRTIDGPVFVDPGSNNYQPAPNSATIDAGDSQHITSDIFDLDNDGDTAELIPIDELGNPRQHDDPGIPGSSVDIGAYEFQGTSCLADVNNDGSLTPTDFTAWINAFNNNQPPADQNRDGDINAADFTAWIANFNAGC